MASKSTEGGASSTSGQGGQMASALKGMRSFKRKANVIESEDEGEGPLEPVGAQSEARKGKGKGKAKAEALDDTPVPFSLDAAKQAASALVANLPVRAKLLFLKLSEQYERYTPTQLVFTANQLSRETRCQNELREYEADATNWVAAWGKSGEGGFVQLMKKTCEGDGTQLTSIQLVSHFFFVQHPTDVYSIQDVITAILHNGGQGPSVADFHSASVSPEWLKVMAARSKDLFEQGLLRLAVGTTISQAKNPKHMQVYRAVMEKVKEWAGSSALQMYFYAQLDQFACMHGKEALISFKNVLYYIIFTCNFTPSATASSVYFCKTLEEARQVGKSDERMAILRIEGVDGPAFEHVENYARQFELLHSNDMLIRTTPSFLEAMTEVHQVPLTSTDEEREVEKYRAQIKERNEQILARDGPSNRAVEKLNKARATMVSMSSNGSNIKKKFGLANQPVVRLATAAERDAYETLADEFAAGAAKHRGDATQAERRKINKKKRQVDREENKLMAEEIGEDEWKKKREEDRKGSLPKIAMAPQKVPRGRAAAAHSSGSAGGSAARSMMRVDGKGCEKCGTMLSSVWRCGVKGEILCNGCGLADNRAAVRADQDDDETIELDDLNDFFRAAKMGRGGRIIRRSTAVEKVAKGPFSWAAIHHWLDNDRPPMKSNYIKILKRMSGYGNEDDSDDMEDAGDDELDDNEEDGLGDNDDEDESAMNNEDDYVPRSKSSGKGKAKERE